VNDRERAILLYVARFGASRVSDICLPGNGNPPSKSEIDALVRSGWLYQASQTPISRRSSLRDVDQIYWGLTEYGVMQAKKLMR